MNQSVFWRFPRTFLKSSMWFIAGVVLAGSAAFIYWTLRSRRLVGCSVLFVVSNSIMFIGSVPLLEPYRDDDAAHVFAMATGIGLFMVGSFAVAVGARVHRLEAAEDTALRVEVAPVFRMSITILLVISAAVGVVYYLAAGTNMFLQGLPLLFSGGIEDAATTRLSTYAGERYLAPGYANQFKNILFPVLAAYVTLRAYVLRESARHYYAACFCLISPPLIAGTGQRGAIVIAAAITVIFVWRVLPPSRRLPVAAGLFSATVLLFMLLSLILGRRTADIGGFEAVVSLGLELVARIFHDNQYCSVVGFRYVHSIGPVWGTAWLEDLLGLLPGYSGSRIDSEIFEMLYGSDRGTAPLSNWGSAYYNFGVFGPPLLGLGLGIVYALVDARFETAPRSLFSILVFSALSVVLGSWCVGSPLFLFNSGAFTLAVLAGIVSLMPKRFVLLRVSPEGRRWVPEQSW